MLSKNKTPVQHMYGPGSSKVIPPTPTFITQRSESKSEVINYSFIVYFYIHVFKWDLTKLKCFESPPNKIS